VIDAGFARIWSLYILDGLKGRSISAQGKGEAVALGTGIK